MTFFLNTRRTCKKRKTRNEKTVTKRPEDNEQQVLSEGRTKVGEQDDRFCLYFSDVAISLRFVQRNKVAEPSCTETDTDLCLGYQYHMNNNRPKSTRKN